MMFDKLPNEILEKVLSKIVDDTGRNLSSCRLVNRRWNSVATKLWRHLPSTQVKVSNKKEIFKFMDIIKNSRIADFPFCKIRFKLIDHKNINPALCLLIELSPFIEDIHIDLINGDNSSDFRLFLQAFDISLMPNLVRLRIDNFRQVPIPPTLNLSKLHTCQISTSTAEMEELANFIVKSARNLQIFTTYSITGFNVNGVAPTWEFDEDYKRIGIIRTNLRVDKKFSNSKMFTPLFQKLDKWNNIQVTELEIATILLRIKPEGEEEPNVEIAKVRLSVLKLINTQAHCLKGMLMHGPYGLNLPVMPQLEWLELHNVGYHSPNTYRNNGVMFKIEGNPFQRLQKVVLNWYHDQRQDFVSAVLDSVKTFSLTPYLNYDVPKKIEDCTHWDKVFPNLESFSFTIGGYTSDEMVYLGKVFTRLHNMKCLKHLSVVSHNLTGTSNAPTLRDILSGFPDFDKVISGARGQNSKSAEDEGHDNFYWTEMELERTPCLVNMTGLKSFYLRHWIDDSFALGILLRMKPLSRLTIRYAELSEEMMQKLKARHGYVTTRLPGSE